VYQYRRAACMRRACAWGHAGHSGHAHAIGLARAAVRACGPPAGDCDIFIDIYYRIVCVRRRRRTRPRPAGFRASLRDGWSAVRGDRSVHYSTVSRVYTLYTLYTHCWLAGLSCPVLHWIGSAGIAQWLVEGVRR
jgi:hypothetical protein